MRNTSEYLKISLKNTHLYFCFTKQIKFKEYTEIIIFGKKTSIKFEENKLRRFSSFCQERGGLISLPFHMSGFIRLMIILEPEYVYEEVWL